MPNLIWMIYGAYGYTGALVVEEAVRRGHCPLLAGRSGEKLRPLAEQFGLDWAVIDLDDRASLSKAVAGVDLVFHAAGPFTHTSDLVLSQVGFVGQVDGWKQQSG